MISLNINISTMITIITLVFKIDKNNMYIEIALLK